MGGTGKPGTTGLGESGGTVNDGTLIQTPSPTPGITGSPVGGSAPTTRLKFSRRQVMGLLLVRRMRATIRLAGKEFDPGPEATIGRSPKCTVSIPDEGISRTHAKIEKRLDSYIITDLGSAAGIFVNDARVGEHQLADGDEVKLSENVTFRFETGEELVFHDEAQIAGGRTEPFGRSTIMRPIEEADDSTFVSGTLAASEELATARRHIEPSCVRITGRL